MSARKNQTKRIRIGRPALLGLAAILMTGPALAESGWSRLADIISPSGARGRAQEKVDAIEEQRAEAAAVQAGHDESQQVAALNNENPLAIAQDGETIQYSTQTGKEMDLGLESDDQGMLRAMELSKNPEILRLMGDGPRFRYNANGRQDPMLVPWVRNAAIFNELNTLADRMMKSGQLDQAAEAYKKILDLKDSRYQAQTLARLNTLMNMKNDQARRVLESQNVVVEAPAELPLWINDNTTAVMVSGGQQLCLVGDHMLAVGDTVPNYPDVHVASIGDDKVLYQIKSKTFEVQLTNR